MRKLKINELKKLISEEVKKEQPEGPRISKEVPQIPYPETRVNQAVENLKKVIGKELSIFGVRTLLAALIDMSFAKLHKLPASDKTLYAFYQNVYLEARKLMEFVKDNNPYG